MKKSISPSSYLTVISLAACCAVATSQTNQGVVKIPLEKLLTLDPKDVPERVYVSGMRGVGSKALPCVDVEAYILETIPKNWKLEGKGKLSVSDKYSNAGKKSIRWDWKAGDILRITDLGIISEMGGFSTHFDGGISAQFTLSAFVENKYAKDAEFNMYYQMVRANNNWDPKLGKLGLAKIDRLVPAGFCGTWFEMSEHSYHKTGTGAKFVAKYDLHGKEIPDSNTYPEGLPVPVNNELIIQAPTNMASGTIYLDRLIAVASKHTKEKHRSPIGGISKVAPVKPMPESFKKKIPKSLTPSQQKWIDDLRVQYFPSPSTETNPKLKRITDVNSPAYKNIEAEAKKYLDIMCDTLPDGSYKFKEGMNYNRDRVYFKGDMYNARKFHAMIPKKLSDGSTPDLNIILARKHAARVNQWILQCPESKVVQDYFKAYYDWEMYQMMNAPFIGPPGGKYGYSTGMSKKLVSLFRQPEFKDKPEFKKYSEFFGRLAVSGDAERWGIQEERTSPSWGLEWPHAKRVFEDMIFEQDDRKLYAMLQHYRDNWSWFYSISTPGRSGMIKPDYTYFHHGIASYWGNFHGHIKLGEAYMNTPLDFHPSIHRTLANHSIRTTIGGPIVGLKGEQQNPWWGQGGMLKQKRMEQAKYIEDHKKKLKELNAQYPDNVPPREPLSGVLKRSVAQMEKLPNNQVFRYLHDIDWKKVPDAKKYLNTVLGDWDTTNVNVKNELLEKYPKLKDLNPQLNHHTSYNYTGASLYFHGQSAVACGSYRDSLFIRAAGVGFSWVRNYGVLYPLRRDSITASHYVGLNPYGYDYSKVPGITLPEISTDRIDKPTGMINNGPARGNGSLSFNETGENLAKYGNYGFRIYPEAGKKLLAEYGVNDFKGLKSYHFVGDKVVALGSEIQADTKLLMQTVLFQEMTDVVPWVQTRNPGRWNPEAPTIVYNNKLHKGSAKVSAPMNKDSYIISPYGHAYLIPGGQDGKLDIEWKKRSFPISAYGNKGKKEGTGALARIIQKSDKPSKHHYCLLLNSDGKSPKELNDYAKATLSKPNYKVLKLDGDAHAVSFKGEAGEKDVFSYMVFEPNKPLNIPHIDSTNRQMNLMVQENEDGNLVISVCDPELDYDIHTGKADSKGQYKDASFWKPGQYNKQDPRHIRRLTVRFKNKVEILEARSGLPQSNPALNAKVTTVKEGDKILFELSFDTRDAVSDTFVLKMN